MHELIEHRLQVPLHPVAQHLVPVRVDVLRGCLPRRTTDGRDDLRLVEQRTHPLGRRHSSQSELRLLDRVRPAFCTRQGSECAHARSAQRHQRQDMDKVLWWVPQLGLDRLDGPPHVLHQA